jgi:hypothetical protein
VVADYNSISGQAEDISYASGICKEKLGLKGKAIAVAAGHLEYGLAAALLDSQAAADRGETHHGTLVVSDIQRIDFILEKVNMVEHLLDVCPLGRTDFAGYHEFARFKNFPETRRHSSSFMQS